MSFIRPFGILWRRRLRPELRHQRLEMHRTGYRRSIKGKGVQLTISSSNHQTETILLVESDRELGRLAVETLVPFGYQVLVATNESEALSLILRNPGLHVALFIADLVMPAMGEMEVACRLAKALSSLKSKTVYFKNPICPRTLAAKVHLFLG